jgi:hypothetical protein
MNTFVSSYMSQHEQEKVCMYNRKLTTKGLHTMLCHLHLQRQGVLAGLVCLMQLRAVVRLASKAAHN